jgi:methionyl-tRNA formyltransferase
MKYSLLFLGTSEFAVPILERLNKEHTIKAVVTQPDKPAGRKQELSPSPVKIKALELGLKVLQPSKASEIPELVSDKIDFLITASYGQYLPAKVLKMPLKDSLNVHPSLLPLYRGATPMQSALLNGDTKTGVSIIRMAKEMDAGAIYSQLQFPLDPAMRYPELEKKCSDIGAELICSVIKNYHSMSPQDQDESKATHCAKITKEDGLIDWQKETSEQIYNKLRAFTPWPGVYTFFKEQKLSLLDFSHQDTDYSKNPGTVFQNGHVVGIKTISGAIILKTVQIAGKKPTDSKSFLNGYPDFLKTQLS